MEYRRTIRGQSYRKFGWLSKLRKELTTCARPFHWRCRLFKLFLSKWGGYPSSGPIAEDLVIKQFFIEGRRDGHTIAYLLSWNASTERVELNQVDRVIFNELGDYSLSGVMLQEYMKNGGYAKFGAPIGDPHPSQGDGGQFVVQEFAKGWTLQAIATIETNP